MSSTMYLQTTGLMEYFYACSESIIELECRHRVKMEPGFLFPAFDLSRLEHKVGGQC